MNLTTSLHQLIKSLNKNEKGYFKKYITRFSAHESNYAKLFDAIDAQKAYDEKKIITRFKEERFVRQLSVTKKILFEIILSSLRSYRLAASGTAQINKHIENAEILYARSLVNDAMGELEKARQMAMEYDLPERLIEIDRLLRNIHLELSPGDWDSTFSEIHGRIDSSLQNLSALQDLQKIHFKLLHFWRQERLIRTEQDLEYIEGLIGHSLLGLEPSVQNFYIHQTILTIRMIYHFLKNEDEQAYFNMKQVLKLWQDNPLIMKAQPIRYIGALNNFLSTCVKTNRFNEIEDCLNNLDTGFLDGNASTSAIFFDTISNYRFQTYYAKNDFEGLLEKMKEAELEMKKHEGNINPVRLMLFKFNILMIFFATNHFEEALVRANELLAFNKIELRQDIHAALRILNLIIHHELGNNLLLLHAIKSTRRFLNSRNKLYETERVFFRHFSRLSLKADKKQRQQSLANMEKELGALFEENPLEKNFLQTLDLLLWIKSKQEGISIANYLKEESREYR